MKHAIVIYLLGLLLTLPALAQRYRTLEPEAGTDSADRVALVIGNSDYAHYSDLQNPSHDADDMAQALRALGFTVVTGADLGLEAMNGAVDAFIGQLRSNTVALFFYAGHGAQVDGVNYLIPVDQRIQAAYQIQSRALDVEEVLRGMQASGSRVNLLFLDACCHDVDRCRLPHDAGQVRSREEVRRRDRQEHEQRDEAEERQ